MHYYALLFLMYELSTPFLNGAWIVSRCNGPSWLVVLSGGGLVLSFFTVRLLVGPFCVYKVWMDLLYPRLDMVVLSFAAYFYTISSAILSVLNVFWFYKIIQFALRASGKSTKAGQSKSS